MALYFDKWYKEFGIRYTQHITNTLINNIKDFEFPKLSVLHFSVIGDEPIVPTKKTNILINSPKDVIVNTIVEYSKNDNLIGKHILIPKPATEVVKESKEKESEFIFLRPDQELYKGPDSLYINSYGYLNSRYRYPNKLLERYHRYHNFMSTVIDNLDYKKDRKPILLLEIPNTFPSRLDLNRFSKEIKPVYLNKLPSYKHFTILEFWKLFTPEYREQSIFNKIPIERMKDITLMFTADNRFCLINMYKLLSIVKEYDLKSDVNAYKSELAKKVLYLMFYNLGTAPVLKNVSTNVKIKAASTNKKVRIKSKTEEDNNDNEYTEEDIEEEYNDTVNEDVADTNDVEVIEETEDIEENITVDDEGVTKTLNTIETSINTVDSTIDNEDDIYYNNNNYFGVKNKIDNLYNSKVITKKQYNDYLEILEQQRNTRIPYLDNEVLSEVLDDTKDDYKLNSNEVEVTDSNIILDKSVNKITTQAVQKKYINSQYKKDIIRTIYSLQNSNSIILDYSTEYKKSVTGELEEHNITIKTLNGTTNTIKVVLPVLQEDGSFEYSGSKYVCRQQISDQIIRKVNSTRVLLSTYYGKINISKGENASDNIGKWLVKKFTTLQKENKISGLILGDISIYDVKLPKLYFLLARNIKSFRYKEYLLFFNYIKRYDVFTNIKEDNINVLEKEFKDKNVVLVGKYQELPLVMDFDNRIFLYKNKEYIEQENILDSLGIDLNNGPMEYASIQLIYRNLPIVLLLSYYIGFNNLLSLLNTKYEEVIGESRIRISNDKYKIAFKDKTYIIEKDNGISDLILSGWNKYDFLKEIDSIVLEDKNLFNIIFSKIELTLNVINEIKTIETMFVDPVSYTILKEMNLPTTFKGLLLKSAELLVSDYYTNPNDIKDSLIKGYERITGMMYSELTRAIKEHENRSYFSKSKIQIHPYAVINKLQEDSSTVSLDNLNPIARIKQSEDTTKIGSGGRTKLTMSKDTRVVNETDIGIISEATKDSGDVGITAQLTANPKLNTTRGLIGNIDLNNDGWSSLVSTSAMLAPFGLSDDVKRLKIGSL